MIAPINRTLLRTIFAKLAQAKVKYCMGSKVSPLTADSNDVDPEKGLDCSGLVQFLTARASDQAIILPEGSSGQIEWCLAHDLTRRDYASFAGRIDNVLRLNFISAERSQSARGDQSARHAFFTFNGMTMESHGRDAHGNGCDSRVWDTPVLMLADYCFEFPSHP